MVRTDDTELTAFTDGCPGLRSILADAGVMGMPVLDWFHLSVRLQHAKQVAEGLPASEPDQLRAKAAIVAEVERLRWRTWNGKATNIRITLKRIRKLLPAFKRETARKLKVLARQLGWPVRDTSGWPVGRVESRALARL